MKTALLVLLLALSSVSQAKTLQASCVDDEGRTVELTSEIVNAAQPQKITSLKYKGTEVEKYKDVSASPIYNKGVITIAINVGYSSIGMTLQNCEDSFLAQGAGQLKLYVGGFAGTSLNPLKCSCELK